MRNIFCLLLASFLVSACGDTAKTEVWTYAPVEADLRFEGAIGETTFDMGDLYINTLSLDEVVLENGVFTDGTEVDCPSKESAETYDNLIVTAVALISNGIDDAFDPAIDYRSAATCEALCGQSVVFELYEDRVVCASSVDGTSGSDAFTRPHDGVGATLRE